MMILDIHIARAESLKEKRRVLKSVKTNLRNKFNISISELDYHELWQRSRVGIVRIGNRDTKQVFDKMLNYLKSIKNIDIIDFEIIRLT